MSTNANVDILLRIREEGLSKMREVAAETGGLAGTFQRLTAGLGLFGGVATMATTAAAAIFATGKSMADLSEQVTRASKVTGVGSEDLQAMFKIVKDGGGDTEALVRALAKFRAEVGQGNPLLAKLGITTGSVEERFTALLGVLSRSKDEFKKASVAQELMGKTGEQMLAHADELASGTLRTAEAMRASHEMISKSTSESLEKTDSAFHKLASDWKGAWNDLASAAAGPAGGIAKFMDGIINMARTMGHAIHDGTVGIADDLASAETSTATFSEKLAKMQEEARKVHGHVQIGVPTIEGIGVTAPRNKDPLDQIISDMERARQKEAERRREQLEDTLTEHTFKPSFGPQLTEEDQGHRAMLATLTAQFKNQKFADEVKTELTESGKYFIEFAIRVQESLDRIGSSVFDTFYTALLSLNDRTTTFASFEKAIFSGLFKSLEQEVAHFISSAATNAFIKFLGIAFSALFPQYAPIILAVTSGATGLPIGLSPLTAGPSAGPAGPLSSATLAGNRGGNTYYFNMISSKDIEQSMRSPTGEMRRANDRLVEVMRAS